MEDSLTPGKFLRVDWYRTYSYKYKFLRPIFPIHYSETYNMDIEERKINHSFQRRLLPEKVHLPTETYVVDTQSDKIEEDGDEFFDAISEEE